MEDRGDGRINLDLKRTGCEDGKWMEQTQDEIQWSALVLMGLYCQRLGEVFFSCRELDPSGLLRLKLLKQ